jgi:hypothetical protein
VQNPLLSTAYLNQLKTVLIKGTTRAGDTRAWFESQDIPVSYTSKTLFYSGNEKYAELIQQLDPTHFILMRFRAGTGDIPLFETAELVIFKPDDLVLSERHILDATSPAVEPESGEPDTGTPGSSAHDEHETAVLHGG